jgi:hypothetical protein
MRSSSRAYADTAIAGIDAKRAGAEVRSRRSSA